MAYIGNIPADKYQTLQKQSFTTSATDTYTLSYAVTNPQDLALFINNVRQNPNNAYTVSNTTLTLSSAITSSDTMYAVFLGRAVETVAPATGSVTNAMLAGSINESKLAGSIPTSKISGSLGKIGQVVSGTTSTSVSVSGNNVYVDTGLTASITPSATTSKILVLVSQAIFLSSNDGTSEQTSNYKLLRDSTSIFETPNNSDLRVTAEHAPNNELRIGLRQNLNILDTPSTTSQITYKTQLQKRSGVVSVAQDNSSPSHITLMEVLA